MADESLWSKRVEEWEASGLTSAEFIEGQPFSASALRYWRKRLEKTAAAAKSSRAIRVAKVVRADTTSAPRAEAAPVVIEATGLRILVPPSADRESLRLVLDVLRELAGAAR